MTQRPAHLPEFDAPPVVEVVLGAQFDHLPNLRGPVLAGWDEIRTRFPIWTEHPVIEPQREFFGSSQTQPQLRFTIPVLPEVRSWFMDSTESELLQVQQDFVVKNWRRGASPYPRYENLRDGFARDYEALERLVTRSQVGKLRPHYCEVTYVNQIPIMDADLGTILAGWSATTSDTFLTAPEQFQTSQTHVVPDATGKPWGRLHIVAKLGRVGEDRTLFLTLTARGVARSRDLNGVLGWFDVGREWIVRGFTSYTATAAHQQWKRRT